MAVYRIYFVEADGRLQPGEAFYCQTDGEAVRRLPPPQRPAVRAELWQGGRFVAIAGRRQASASL